MRGLVIIGFMVFFAMLGSILHMQWDLIQMRDQLTLIHADLVTARSDFWVAQSLPKKQ